MVVENKNRNTVIFYSCGICNLNCRYCGINKNKCLPLIDQRLEESFKGDYYFNRVKEYFPRKDMLRTFETWGGEPFLRMDRIYPLIHQLIEEYPYFDSGYSSTNFSYSTWTDQFFGLMDCFGDYPHRDFSYCLQLSMDGPEYITDAGRGKGVTKRCLENFKKLTELLGQGRLPKNVRLTITLKGTLDNATFQELCNREKIIEYYKFYEDNFIRPIRQLNLENVFIAPGIPNTAVPSPVTVEEGRKFARLVKMCRELEAENREHRIFEFYDVITPFHNNVCQNWLSYQYGYHTCGTGDVSVGLLPDNMVSTCHEGFTQIVEEYEKLAAADTNEHSTITFDKFRSEQAIALCCNDDEYYNHHYKMSLFNKDNATARLATSASMIIGLAMAGEIEAKYVSDENALKAAIFIQGHTSYCIKDNYNKTGSYTLAPVGIYKLLLNGAMEWIQCADEMHTDNQVVTSWVDDDPDNAFEYNTCDGCSHCGGCRL